MRTLVDVGLTWTGTSWKLIRYFSDGSESIAYYSRWKDEREVKDAVEKRLDITDPEWRDVCGNGQRFTKDVQMHLKINN
jgi:hypothetical protein